jgi:hypothetical protein
MEPERIIDGINIPAASDNVLGLLKKANEKQEMVCRSLHAIEASICQSLCKPQV